MAEKMDARHAHLAPVTRDGDPEYSADHPLATRWGDMVTRPTAEPGSLAASILKLRALSADEGVDPDAGWVDTVSPFDRERIRREDAARERAARREREGL